MNCKKVIESKYHRIVIADHCKQRVKNTSKQNIILFLKTFKAARLLK